ncbi:nuclear transcription factor Y subunit C-6-like [Brachypodium distachyon]|uniref:nuclear transcription factor Y subunit C-6-like n=1 Tax=Brachypodium distachyon TaxID=15368 RepID=UPI000D0E1534|nr:nuclear transcription factor Y subunit C-6-like [Brachypodium distachyon]|eukprot:XP_024317145.1 nuclear transcription factor Y subunit C-6-like [Brachypodium distachyon]
MVHLPPPPADPSTVPDLAAHDVVPPEGRHRPGGRPRLRGCPNRDHPTPAGGPTPRQQLQDFWTDRMAEIEQISEFKTHNVPLARPRIKKIMKAAPEKS